MDRKGLELPFDAVFTGLIVLGAAVFIYLLLFARIQDVHVILAEKEAEIHAINLAQVLLSSNLTYFDGYAVQRGVFDKKKLDAGQLERLDIWYPDAIAVVGIEDLETGEKWKAVLSPKQVGGVAVSDLLDCLKNTFSLDISMIFRIPNLSPWEWPDMVKCDARIADEIVPAVRDFPVAIRVSDSEIRSGKMIISLRELILGVI